MKNLIKPMIVFGMILFLLGAMASCKEKNEEKEIEDLVEKMGEAKTEQEAAKIAEKIEKLEQRSKKSSKEIIVKLGQPFTFWQHGQGPSDPQKKSEFRMTFKDPLVDKFLPYEPKFMEVFRGQKTPLRRTPADQEKKYFGIVAKIENLGPRETSFKRHMELKVDRGYIYRLVATGIVDDPEEDYPREIYTLEPGKTGWLRLWCQIPEDTYPVEVFGKLGEGYYAAPGYIKFRLELTQERKETAPKVKISKDDIVGRYILPKTFYTIADNSFGKCIELKNDGTFLFSDSVSKETYHGKWEAVPVISFSYSVPAQNRPIDEEKETKSFEGQVKEDTILMNMNLSELEGPPRGAPWVEQAIGEKVKRWVKQKGGNFLERLDSRNTVWSDYTHLDATFNLRLQKNGTFEAVFPGRYRVSDKIVTLYDPTGKIESVEAEIRGDNLVLKLPLEIDDSRSTVEIVHIKAQNAQEMQKTKYGILWSKYYQELWRNAFRRFKKDGTLEGGFSGNWTILGGIICGFEDTQWKLEARNNTLIDESGITFVKQEGKTEVFPKEETIPRLKEMPSQRKVTTSNKLRPEPQFKKLSMEQEFEAQKLWEWVKNQRKMGRLPVMGYGQMVKSCREIIRRWPYSEYAFKAKRTLADLPERYHKMYNITRKETDLSNFYQTPATNKQELVDAIEDLRHAMIKKIQLDVDVTAQCFTSVKEYRRAKLLADVLRPVLRVLQGTLSVLSKISDTTTLSGQVKTSLDNAQYVSEATSLFFMVNGLRESGKKLYYAIDDTAGYVRTVKDMLQAADQTTVVRMDPRAYKQVIKQYLDSEQGTPLVIARTSELAPDKKPAKGALVLYKTIREEFRTLIEQIQRSELPPEFPVNDVVAEIEQLKHQIIEAGVHNIDVHYSIYHQGRKVHQSRKLGAVAEHNKAFAQVAGALAKRLDIEIYAECAQLAATGADAAYIVTYKVPGAGEAVKMTQQVSLLPQIVIEGKKMFTVDPEEQFYQMPQEILFSLAIEFSSLLRIADDTVLSLTELLKETRSQVPPGEVQPTPTSTNETEGTS